MKDLGEGFINNDLAETQYRLRHRLTPRIPLFQYPRLPKVLNKTPQRTLEGEKVNFPDIPNMKCVQYITDYWSASPHDIRVPVILGDIDTIMTLCGYNPDKWSLRLNVVRPHWYFDLIENTYMNPYLPDFCEQLSNADKEKKHPDFPVTYRTCKGRISVQDTAFKEGYDIDVLISHEQILAMERSSNHMWCDLVEDNPDNTWNFDRNDVLHPALMSAFLTNSTHVGLGQMDMDRVVDVSIKPFDDSWLDNAEQPLKCFNEHIEAFRFLPDGEYVMKGDRTFLDDIIVKQYYTKKKIRQIDYEAIR
eukprot:UN24112